MRLPTYHGTLVNYQMSREALIPRTPLVGLGRIAFAAAHVVSDPLAERDPWHGRPSVDWENCLRFRHYLWDQGLNLAEAMDTAQRGMGVDWLTARELIERTMKEAKAHPLKPRVACGAGTDQYQLEELTDLSKIQSAYSEQMEVIEAAGGQCIILASRAMAVQARHGDDYLSVYSRLIEQAADPVILHWLGDMFDPALTRYWGSDDLDRAEDLVLQLIQQYADSIDGIKISLLDQSREEGFRRKLPEGVMLYTGDDFNYAALIKGDGTHYSHALLGIFAAIAPAASQALEALALGEVDIYDDLLAPTVPLSREIFKSPTPYYKAGVAFLAWLNDAQSHFIMPAGFQSSREICHYAEIFRLADAARLLTKPDIAEERMGALLKLHGIG